uniref:5-oxoprolinase n=1 Tax=Bionectria ochroleuca TaxID=29856 RepID=A0A0B7KNX7_BIOOC
MSVKPKSIEIAIDRGGTFTDVWAKIPGKPDVVLKLLSVNPDTYDDAPSEGIRRVLEIATGESLPRSKLLPKELIYSIRMGTTVATNALLERKGTRHAFVVSEGFRDLLDIGYQTRPSLFALGIRKPELLYDQVCEISERVVFEGFEHDSRFGLDDGCGKLVRAVTGDLLRIVKPLDESEVREKLSTIRGNGTDTLAICLKHSYLYPDHELRIASIAKEMGFHHVSVSSVVGRGMIKMIPRGSSSTADAYLTPKIKEYIGEFLKRFESSNLDGVICEFMQSDGGLTSYDKFTGLGGILSGPAGGVVGYARTSYDGSTPLIGFDMGGTSTDVSRYGGMFEHVFETKTAGVSIQSPQLDINTVAAGGGSMLFWTNGLFKVGPESAGAHPGPAAYRKGGPLTVTDANIFLGRILPSFFPSIFGPDENLPLDTEIVAKKFKELAAVINAESGRSMTAYEIALGFLDVANEAMCRPIRAITEARGFDTGHHHLAVFGGAGGQHACEIASKLGIKRIIIHKYSSFLSAYGMALAEVVQEAQEPSSEVLSAESLPKLQARIEALKQKAREGLAAQGIPEKSTAFESYLNLRYDGTNTNFMIQQVRDVDWRTTLEETHLRELSFAFPSDHRVLVDDIRIRAIGMSETVNADATELLKQLAQVSSDSEAPAQTEMSRVYFSRDPVDAQIISLKDIKPGTVIPGPCTIVDSTQTIVLMPGSIAKVLSSHIVIEMPEVTARNPDGDDIDVVDPVKLSVFSHRFMSIAEQMGLTLQKTSISLNIKERLDFSCAIFGPEGDLVANAPHVPVHLGSMSYAVKYQHQLHKGNLRPGDVLVSNHSAAGGTHLPDITVISPVFEMDGKTFCFYTASRGHHTDIGGLDGTSMPPNSVHLWQEGAMIESFFLVRDGKFDEQGIVKLLTDPGQYPRVTPSRKLSENLSDLKAQIAANTKGSQLIVALMGEYGTPTVHFYMDKIQKNAELAPLQATDGMDNGATMMVEITIDGDGGAVFDFTGTSPQMHGNMNAPPAITYSAIIYMLRLLIGSDIPLNQGCLSAVDVVIPEGTFLNPEPGAAVACGNTHTSQRLADLLLQAFEAASGSQGCMNCFAFFDQAGYEPDGTPILGYGYKYGETICGGEGAGPGWHGASGVQIHMTSTRTTDVELLERRLPIIIREFSIRRGSGGRGRWNGGDGIVRDWECRVPLTFSIISERRVRRPHGMRGGQPGAAGRNFWAQKTEDGAYKWIQLPPSGLVEMGAGDRCVVHTPSGGGWGVPDETHQEGGAAEDHVDTARNPA